MDKLIKATHAYVSKSWKYMVNKIWYGELNHNGPVQETGENEIRELNKEIEKLRRENKDLKEENIALRNKMSSSEKLKKVLKEKEKENVYLVKLKNELNQKIQQLTDEKKMLFKKIKDCKGKRLVDLQLDGQVCAKNCSLCAVLCECKQKLGYSLCGPQLALIMFKLAPEEITNEDLKCENMLHLIKKCKIVRVYAEYLYPHDEVTKVAMMNEAWDKLMTMGERACILGVKSPKAFGGGHCVEVDLQSRTMDRKVMMYDPQAPDEKSANMSKAEFINYIEDAEGLRLYTVDLERLNQIINEHREILHFTDGQSFFSVTSDV